MLLLCDILNSEYISKTSAYKFA